MTPETREAVWFYTRHAVLGAWDAFTTLWLLWFAFVQRRTWALVMLGVCLAVWFAAHRAERTVRDERRKLAAKIRTYLRNARAKATGAS